MTEQLELGADLTSELADARTPLHRMLDQQVRMSRAAALLFDPQRSPVEPLVSCVTAYELLESARLIDRHSAQSWFDAECDILLAAVEQAYDGEFPAHVWHLAWALEPYLGETCRWREWLATQQLALASALRLGDWLMQGRSHLSLGRACLAIGDVRRAHPQLAEGTYILRALGAAVD